MQTHSLTGSTLYTSASERELCLLIAQGDEQAFEELFHRYVPKIEPVIVKMVKSAAVAKDIIQDIFLNVWINRDKLPEIEAPHNWIFKIVYNRTYTWLEQQSVRSKAVMKISASQQEAPLFNQTESSVLFLETARLLSQAVHNLPPQTKRIYLLSREGGLRNQQIAEQLNISVQTVKNTLANAAKSIKQYLADHGITVPLVLILYWMR